MGQFMIPKRNKSYSYIKWALRCRFKSKSKSKKILFIVGTL